MQASSLRPTAAQFTLSVWMSWRSAAEPGAARA
jgi:hypothetical protein